MQHDEDRPMSMKEQVNFLIVIAMIISRAWELPFRKLGTAGSRYFFGGQCVISLFVMFFAISLIGGPADQLIAFYAVGVAVFMLILHRSKQSKLEADGYGAHSDYSGLPTIGGDEIRAKTSWEPAIGFAIGAACLTFSQGLGAWMIWASICMGISSSVARAGMEARRRVLRDAFYEQRAVMNGFA